MRIGKPELRQSNDQIRYEVQTNKGLLWFSVPVEFSDFVSPSADAAAVALLIPAMLSNGPLCVEAPVSELLYYNLKERAQHVIRTIVPGLPLIDIEVEGFTSRATPAAGVATGFSGGVDSFSVVIDHLLKDYCTPGFRLTHLLYNDVGAHGAPGKFDAYFDKITRAAAPLGLPIIKVASNLESFYPPNPTFQQTHSMRNASVAALLQNGIGKFLYASTYRYSDAKLLPSNDIAYADCALVEMLSTEAIRAISVGSQYSRVHKTLSLARYQQTFNTLDVCTGNAHIINCSRCFKCLRTMLTLEIGGQLDRYASVFDLVEYQRHRDWYIGHVLAASDPFSKEIAQLIRDRRFSIPLKSIAHQLKGKVRQLGRRAEYLTSKVPIKQFHGV